MVSIQLPSTPTLCIFC